MKFTNVTVLCILALVSVQSHAVAAPPCPLTDTIDDCANRLAGDPEDPAAVAEAKSERAKESRAAVEERLGELVTGLGIEDSTARTAVTDFLALFAAAAESGNVGDDDVALSFSVSDPIDLPLGDYKVQATLNDPTVYKPLEAAIPEGQRASRISELEPDLGDFDDVSLSLTWGLNGALWNGFQFGRTFGEVEQEEYGVLFDHIYDIVGDTHDFERYKVAVVKVEDLLNPPDNPPRIQPAENATLGELKTLIEEKIPPEERTFEKLMALLEENGAALKAFGASLKQAEDRVKLGRFAELVNNQPQLVIHFGARVRDEVVGPEEYTAKVQLELPLATNWNSYLRYRDRKCGGRHSFDCWAGFARKELRDESDATSGDRFTVAAEYRRIDDYDVSVGMGDDLVALQQQDEDTLDVMAGYGRYFGILGSDPGGTRFDVSLMYHETFGSDMRQDRIVGSATLTRQLFGGAALVFGINYANKAEFRQESDKEFGANFGLVYRFTES